MTYMDEKIQLGETDLDVLSKAKPLEENELLSTGTSYEDSLETSGATIHHPSRDQIYWQLRAVTRAGRKTNFYSTSIILCYNGYQGVDEDFNFGISIIPDHLI